MTIKKFCLSFAVLSLMAWPFAAFAKDNPELIVRGIKGDILENVQTRLKIERKEMDAHPDTENQNEFLQKAPQQIKEAIEPYGYFSPSVRSHLERHGKSLAVFYDIELNAPVRVTHLEVKVLGPGADNPKLQRYLQKLPLKDGDIFNVNLYNKLKEKLFDIANDQGYVEAAMLKNTVLITKDTLSANILIEFDTKDRFYFGTLIFNANPYSPKFLSRFNEFTFDEPFSSGRLIEYQQELNDSSYFNQAIVIPDLENKRDHRIPIHISVIPPKSRKYSLGVGYGTFTGPRLTAGINFNRINTSGHSFDAQIKISSVLTGIAGKYHIPGRNPLTDQWILGVGHEKLKPKNGDSRSYSLIAGYTKKVNPWTFSVNANYLIESYTVFGSPSRKSSLLYPNFSVNYSKADSVIDTHWGKSFNLNLQAGSQRILSSTTFGQADLKAKYFATPFSFAHVILRGEIGYTAVHDLTDLPLTMRFLAGGITSIRGYPDSSLGPGKYLEVASIEYQNHITKSWLGAVFYDVGNATNTFNSSLNKGVGVGVIYESPIGPIRLYLAQALSKSGHPYQVEFSMGPEF